MRSLLRIKRIYQSLQKDSCQVLGEILSEKSIHLSQLALQATTEDERLETLEQMYELRVELDEAERYGIKGDYVAMENMQESLESILCGEEVVDD